MTRAVAIGGWLLCLTGTLFAQSPEIQVGDKVSVAADSTKVMSGSDQIGTLAKGTAFTVEKISGAWLQGSVILDGQKRSGWISRKDVAIAAASTPAVKPMPQPNRRPQIELDPWDRPFVFHRREELKVQAGDTIVVTAKEGATLRMPNNHPLYLTEQDHKNGDEYMIPRGTRLKVKLVTYESGVDFPHYHVTLDAGGKKWDGWVYHWLVVKENRFQLAGDRFDPMSHDMAWRQQNFQRNLPRFDRSHDAPETLYGTTPIKQGMFRQSAFDLSNPDLQKEVGNGTYLLNASEDRDISTRREPGTERLLASLPPLPNWEEYWAQIKREVTDLAEARATKDDSELSTQRSAIWNLRATARYDEATELAIALVEKCRASQSEEHWRTRDAELLQRTIETIRSLKGDALTEMTQADASNKSLLRSRIDTLRAFEAAIDQHTTRRDHLGVDNPDTLAAIGWLAFLLRGAAGQDVESLHLDVVYGTRKVLGDSHPWVARALSNLALVRLDRADQEAAQRILVFSVELLRKHQRLATIEGSLIVANLGRALEQQGQREPSLQAFALSRAIARSLNTDDRQQIHSLYLADLALLDHTNAAQFPLALQTGLAFRPAISNNLIPVFRKRFGTWSGGTKIAYGPSQSVNTMTFARMGQAPSASDPIAELTAAGQSAALLGDYGGMERAYREAYRLFATRKDQQNDSQDYVVGMLASVLHVLGNTEEAIRYQQEAIASQRRKWEKELGEIKQKLKLPRDERYGGITFNLHSLLTGTSRLGEMFERQGRLVEAERAFRESLELTQLKKQLEDPELWNSLTAFRHDDVYSKDGDDLANLARIQALRGDLAGAEKTYRSAQAAMFSRWAFQANMNYAKTLAATADVLMRRDSSLAEAAPMAYDSWACTMVMASRGEGYSVMVGAQADVAFAETLRRSGRLAEAAIVLERGIVEIEKQRAKIGGDELSRSQFFTELTRFNPYSAMVRVQVQAGDNFADTLGVGRFGPRVAFDTLEAGRGRALLDLTSRRGGDPGELAMEAARKRNDAALLARVESLRDQQRQARESLTQLASKSSAPTSPQAMQAQATQINSARETDRQAARDLFDIARMILAESSKKPLNSDETAERLRKNELLLAYDIGPRDSVLLTVAPDGQVEGHFLNWLDGKPVTQETLNVAVADFFEEISRETSEANNSVNQVEVHDAEELARAILPDQVRSRLSKLEKVFLVADGALHRLPFESLFLDADGNKVLLDEAPAFVYGSSATIMLGERDAPANRTTHGTDLVALGDATFSRGENPTNPDSSAPIDAPSLGRTRALNRFGQLSPLPGTRAEINAIVSRWPKPAANATAPRVLLGEEATVGNLMKAIEHPRFLHLATHGLAEGGRKAHESALAFAVPETVSLADNGFLTLADLLERWGEKLNGTEMVVLSACRTARGEMSSGDGFVALTWGFLYAGTRCVVASLWEVDDTATALLMSRLYENVLGSFETDRTVSGKKFTPGQPLPKAEALREAKQWLRNLPKSDADKLVQKALGDKSQAPKGDRPFADPYYWAAFVLVGNGD